ncbi:MAG: LacI family DNA-binding transcriptional regulator [Planctomycetota bacterium]
MHRKTPLITDVAKRAGVSTATVSRVANSPELVSPATAQRVRQAMQQLGYRPNGFAKALITRSSRVLGIVLPDFFGDFYSELLRAADTAARDAGYHLVVSSDARAGSEDVASSLPLNFLDGLIAFISFPDPSLLESVVGLSNSVVLIDSGEHTHDVDRIRIDNASGARSATEHLLAQVPASRCYHVGGPSSNFDAVERATAFAATLSEHGASPASNQIEHGEFSAAWGYAWAMQALEAQPSAPVAVFAANDEIAFGILQAASVLGIAVPERLKLVGFDGARLSTITMPELSTVQVPLDEIGARAISLCIERIRAPQSPYRAVTASTRLIVRSSSR